MAELRPKTVKEMQDEKNAKEADARRHVVISNVSNQLVKVHLRAPPGVDFYVGAKDVSLKRGQTHTFQKSRLWMEQITRLQKQKMLRIISDTDDIQEPELKRQVVTER